MNCRTVNRDKTQQGYFFFESNCRMRGLFKGKERKLLEGRIELLEDLEKRLHKSLEQIVKREGYPNVQAFQKVYNKGRRIDYRTQRRTKNNGKSDKTEEEKPLEQPKKASVLEKFAAISRKADSNQNGPVKRNLWIENDKNGGNGIMKKTIFEEMGGNYIRHGDYLIPVLPCRRKNRFIGVWGQIT